MVRSLFACTLFIAAALLFLVEPLIGKRVPGAKVALTSGPLVPTGAEKVK